MPKPPPDTSWIKMVEISDGFQPRRARAATSDSACCDLHNQHCEPPGELCCRSCTEAAHDTFPIRHANGSRCVLEDKK